MASEKIFRISIMGTDITEFMKQGFNTSTLAHKQWTAWFQKFPKAGEVFDNLNARIEEAEKEDPDHIPFSINGQKGYGAIGFDGSKDDCIYQITIK